MLKNTEAEETVHFVVIIFVIGGISNGGKGRLSPTVLSWLHLQITSHLIEIITALANTVEHLVKLVELKPFSLWFLCCIDFRLWCHCSKKFSKQSNQKSSGNEDEYFAYESKNGIEAAHFSKFSFQIKISLLRISASISLPYVRIWTNKDLCAVND